MYTSKGANSAIETNLRSLLPLLCAAVRLIHVTIARHRLLGNVQGVGHAPATQSLPGMLAYAGWPDR